MPIGDLLAQISGGKSTTPETTTPVLTRAVTIPKRKAEDDLRQDDTKTLRRPSPPKSTRPTTLNTTIAPPRPSNGTGIKPATAATRPANGINKIAKSASTSARASPAPAADTSAPKAPPKKGSFAEILARGQRAQAVMGQVGKIQHKKVEKGAVKRDGKDVKDARASDAKALPRGAGDKPNGYAGSARAGQRPGAIGNGALPAKGAKNANTNGSKFGKASRPAEEEPPKKIKKSVQAVTGYSGTARPKPGAAKRSDKEPRGGALLNPPRSYSRPTGRSRHDDEYDEDMDDFIDYDEGEEDEPRYGYASDGSSDMEAGLDELDVEERQAERIARREDIEEARLEQQHKAEKEARKRRAMEAMRSNRR
ncbi:hypothetical protein B0I35DRAFT_475007 [Stachybotrys elegans]|uniref:SPT2 chromatin protein n=1 Tax=Stachybotrys elegans TaxID=80388 RepID=A0A8K0SZ15_9HYPO|nr:hypothetical protein B0I35DRAFT_475007 [Stachybotrys elegans]